MVLVRKSQISRALINILDNANKFAKNIFLTSEILERKWIIKVDDDGPGTTLSQEEMVKPFIKGSEQLNQGTGLGLSIVQKLVKLTNKGKKIIVNLAINYGSKDEIVFAAKKTKKNISIKSIQNNTYTKNQPDPDILIRKN